MIERTSWTWPVFNFESEFLRKVKKRQTEFMLHNLGREHKDFNRKNYQGARNNRITLGYCTEEEYFHRRLIQTINQFNEPKITQS